MLRCLQNRKVFYEVERDKSMTERTKNCPFCGEKIDVMAITCKFCGENIKTNQQKVISIYNNVLEKIKDFKIKKCTLLVLLILVFLFIGSVITYIVDNKSVNNAFGSFNLSEIEEPIDVIGAMSTDENIMKTYLNGIHLQQNKDKIFQMFLGRLSSEVEKYNDLMNWFDFYDYYEYEYEILQSGHPATIKRIELTPKIKTNEYGETMKIYLTSPKMPLMEYVYIGEGAHQTVIDYRYLSENYSMLLGKPFKEYLAIKAKEETDLDGGSYYQDAALGVSKKCLVDWIIALQNFRKKYPKFVSDNMQIEQDINTYTSDLISDLYQTFDFGNDKMYPECKKAYEDFLNRADKDTPEYKVVKECYEILKRYDFKSNDEFWSMLKSYRN